jgi:lipopolysaccharide/colanic/teichoic acid biosynthesis glycosyltransferase
MSMLSLTDSAAHAAALAPRPPAEDLFGPSARAYLAFKTGFDRVTALTLLVLTAPLIVMAMLLVKLTSTGPALYTQTRLGRRGMPFTIYKIRTMTHDCESLTGPCWSLPGDERVTMLGRWLRSTHIDELPQLWNVLRGDMSLIGPRPERPEFAPRLERAAPHYRKRLQLRPGLTGLAQVQLPPDSDLDSVRIKTACDLHYVRSIGPWLDLCIAWATLLRLMGFPFAQLRALFRLPSRDVIEQGYQALVTRHLVVVGGVAGAEASKPR